MSGFEFVSAGGKWDEYLGQAGAGDIYFSSSYHESFAASLGRVPELFVYKDGAEIFVYPYMLGEISEICGQALPEKFYDIESVYGYSGPVSSSEGKGFIDAAWECFYAEATKKNIVCELIKFSPMAHNQKFGSDKTEITLNRKTVSMDLQGDIEAAYHAKLRNDIRRVEKMDIILSGDKAFIPAFRKVYEAHMKKIDAAEFYFFKDEHYEFLQESDEAKLITASYNNQIIAGAVFMLSRPFTHYHLAANMGGDVAALASKYIIHNAAHEFQNTGYKTLHLGGGRSVADDDSLLFFKKRFGGVSNDFYIGKTNIMNEEYRNLCDTWGRLSGKKLDNGFLQVYRLPCKP